MSITHLPYQNYKKICFHISPKTQRCLIVQHFHHNERFHTSKTNTINQSLTYKNELVSFIMPLYSFNNINMTHITVTSMLLIREGRGPCFPSWCSPLSDTELYSGGSFHLQNQFLEYTRGCWEFVCWKGLVEGAETHVWPSDSHLLLLNSY